MDDIEIFLKLLGVILPPIGISNIPQNHKKKTEQEKKVYMYLYKRRMKN